MSRIGVLLYLAVWGALMSGQCGVLYAMFTRINDESLMPPGVGLLLIALLQVAKIVPTTFRLYDQGRPSDNAILTLIPLVNLGLFFRMFTPAPTDTIRDKRLKAWKNRTLAFGALRNGLRAMVQGAAITVPLCLLWGLVMGLVEAFVPSNFAAMVATKTDTQSMLFQGGLGLCALLILYLVVQLFKIRTASRNSWLPTLLILPALLLTFALFPGLGNIVDKRAPAGLAYMAFGTTWWIFAGGFYYTRWVTLGHDLREHGKLDLKRAGALYKERVWGALVPHGGATVATWVGLQLIIPGLVYAMIMSFVVHAAVLHPDKAPFRRSARLTTGQWMRIFNVLALGFLLMIGGYLFTLVATEFVVYQAGASTFVLENGAFAPDRLIGTWLVAQGMGGSVTLPPIAAGVASTVSTFIWGAVMAGLVWVYQERVGEMSRKKPKKDWSKHDEVSKEPDVLADIERAAPSDPTGDPWVPPSE